MQKKKINKLFLTIAIFTLPVFSFAQIFSLDKQNILSSDNKVVGILYKGVALEKKADKVTLSGWVMDGNEYIVFFSNKDRIKLARLKESYTKNLNVKESMEDEYGVIWKKVTLDFKLKNTNKLTNDEHKLWTNEEDLYQRCGSCHKAFPAHEFTANQWPPIMKTMQDNAGFSKSEAKAVSLYLQYESIKEE